MHRGCGQPGLLWATAAAVPAALIVESGTRGVDLDGKDLVFSSVGFVPKSSRPFERSDPIPKPHKGAPRNTL